MNKKLSLSFPRRRRTRAAIINKKKKKKGMQNNVTTTIVISRPPPPNSKNHHRGSSSSSSTTQACAACKYQRRKCVSDCILAPYFPHDSQRQFLNAHRLFGVSNIIKIVRHLNPPAKDHAMRTIIYQSDVRAADPVGGCYRIVRELEHRIALAKAELDIVLHQLALCRAAAVAPQPDTAAADADGQSGAAEEDVNSWGCLPGNAPPPHANAESVSSSFPQENHHRLSTDECNDDAIRPILDQFDCDGRGDDIADEQLQFDSHGNLLSSSSNSVLMENKDEDDDCFAYIQDHEDLKAAAATFFTLTNCDI